ncbi:MAG: FHA domain-containing protein, partial [Singulisphaera sp.]
MPTEDSCPRYRRPSPSSPVGRPDGRPSAGAEPEGHGPRPLERRDVVLRHPAVSKRHAAIERIPGGYLLKDLDSRAGTYADDRRVVGPLALREGTRIRICNHQFAFSLPPIGIRDDDSSTICHAFAVATGVGGGDARPPGTGPGERLQAVLKIGRALGSTLELGEVLEVALAALFDIMPQAERGSILLGAEA